MKFDANICSRCRPDTLRS